MSSDVQLAEALVSRFPSLQDVYESYMEEGSAAVPEVFFWEVVQDVIAAFLAGDDASLDWRAVLAFMESRVGRGDSDVDRAIVGGFLWYLPWPGQPGYEIVTMLGPVLTARFKRMRPKG